jgi:phytoene dehydrogenase-like protein
MTKSDSYDAIIIGSGPNGLAAAITLAQAGRSVCVYEAKPTVGGGMRSAELTLPGFVHDICSAIHPLGVASPFFRTLPLEKHGLEWIHPALPLAHPFDDGTAAFLDISIEKTAAGLGADGAAYRRLMKPVVKQWDSIADVFLGPLTIPLNPFPAVEFGLRALWSAQLLADMAFKTEQAKGLFAGLAAHSLMPMEKFPSAAFGLVLGVLGHVVGWPLPRGGSQQIADALVSYLRTLDGEIIVNHPVESLDELPQAHAYLFDTSPRALMQIVGDRLPEGYQNQLRRYRYNPGVFKVDWALSEPIPWTADECRQAGTVHLGGTLDEIAISERGIWRDEHVERPYVLMAQHSPFDPTRAPDGKHTAWGYCHVPHGSMVDMTERIENQIERFAPGFRDCILDKHMMNTADYEQYNPNYIGGDINGGVQDFLQLFTRPSWSLRPYRTPAPGIYLCSSATPPGGGVHGMCGYHAAKCVIHDFG